jgi:hypothetical protein
MLANKVLIDEPLAGLVQVLAQRTIDNIRSLKEYY